LALCWKKSFQELALINANQVAILALEKPDAHVRHQLESGAKAALGAPRASGDTANSSRSAREKTNQAISFAQRIGS
jgi:hypothetical protein